MSPIWDRHNTERQGSALNSSTPSRASGESPSRLRIGFSRSTATEVPGRATHTDREFAKGHRRSKRLCLPVPVILYGRGADRNSIHEGTHMVSVNADGGLLTIAANVRRDQTLTIVNGKTREERECRIVYIGRILRNGRKEIGVEFTQPAPNFWQLSFPPMNR